VCAVEGVDVEHVEGVDGDLVGVLKLLEWELLVSGKGKEVQAC
jgi:hypothetical protein